MKKETLEEAAERLYPAEWDWKEKESFIEGAQWQQERSYSEEDMKLAFEAGYDRNTLESLEIPDSEQDYRNFKEWFEQFKNK